MSLRFGTRGVAGIIAALAATGVASFVVGRASVDERTSTPVLDLSHSPLGIDGPILPIERVVATGQPVTCRPFRHCVSTQLVAFAYQAPEYPTYQPDYWKRGLIYFGDAPPLKGYGHLRPFRDVIHLAPKPEDLAGPSVNVELDVDAMLEEAGGLAYPTRPLWPDRSPIYYDSAS